MRARCIHCRYFYATLHLGTPPKQFAVIVDTGSTITYVPCASCGRNCGPHHKVCPCPFLLQWSPDLLCTQSAFAPLHAL